VRWVRILSGNFLLNLDRTLHGLDNAGELGDRGIAQVFTIRPSWRSTNPSMAER